MSRLTAALFVCVFLAALVMTALTPMLADDYSYSFSYAEQGKRLETLGDVARSLVAHRYKMNGRLFSHGLAMLFLLCPKAVFNVCNALNTAFLFYLILLYVRQAGEEQGQELVILLAALFLIWLFTPVYGQVFLWLDGSLNYSLAISVVLAFVYPYYCAYLQDYAPRWRPVPKVLFVLFSFAAGAYSENASCAGIFAAVCVSVLLLREKRKMPLTLLISLFSAVFGFFFMMTAPAELGRAAQHDPISIGKNIQRVFAAPNERILPLFCLFAALLVIAMLAGRRGRALTAAIVLLLAAAVSIGVFAFAVYFPWRSLCAASVLLTLACAILMKEIMAAGLRYPIPVLTAVLGCAFLFSFVLGVGDIGVMFLESKQREAAIYETLAEGRRVAEIHQYSSNTKYAAAYELQDVTDDAEQWPNYDIAAYYGLDSVIGLPPVEEFGT